MGHVYPNAIPMPMDSGKPIPMGSKEDMEMVGTYNIIDGPIIQEENHKTDDEEWDDYWMWQIV